MKIPFVLFASVLLTTQLVACGPPPAQTQPGASPSTLPSQGLVALYSFEGNASDSSGNRLDGQTVGAASFVAGRIGQALKLDPTQSGSYVRVANADKLALGSRLSVSAWVKSAIPVEAGSYFPVVTKGFENEDYTMWITRGGPDFLFNWSKTNEFWGHFETQDRADIPTDTWTHVAATYDGSKARFYINGQFRQESNVSVPIDTGKEDFFIGASLPGSADFFNGSLDEIRVYNRALSADEVKALASQK